MKKYLLSLVCIPSIAGFILTACNNGTADSPKEIANEKNEATLPDKMEDDAEDVVSAFTAGLYEIALADSIRRYTKNDDVLKLASMVADGHKKLNDEIKGLAATKSITLPMELSAEQRSDIHDVVSKDPKNLAKDYCEHMVTKHKKSLDLYKDCAENCKDADIRQWFFKSLPAIQQHYDMAKSIDDKLSG